jgi:hypothetical protein
VTQSLRGNSYHTYRTAFLTQAVLASISLPARIQSIALEILHTLGVSLIEQQGLSQSQEQAMFSRGPLPGCPLWTKDETSAVAVASICMACKVSWPLALETLTCPSCPQIVSDELDVPRKSRIIDASDRSPPPPLLPSLLILPSLPQSDHSAAHLQEPSRCVFRTSVDGSLTLSASTHHTDFSITLKRHETQIVRALSYDFQFTTIESQVPSALPVSSPLLRSIGAQAAQFSPRPRRSAPVQSQSPAMR